MFYLAHSYLFQNQTHIQLCTSVNTLPLSMQLRFSRHSYNKDVMFLYTPGGRGIAPLILNLVARWRQVVSLRPGQFFPRKKEVQVHIEYDSGWAPLPV